MLDYLVGDPRHGVPVKLLANRLALSAATATSKLEGRLARERGNVLERRRLEEAHDALSTRARNVCVGD